MGYYYGTATHFKVFKNAPLPALEFIDRFFIELDCRGAFGKLSSKQTAGTGTAVSFAIPEDMIEDMDYIPFMLGSPNPEFALWWWRVKEDHGDYWLYETRGSCKYPQQDFLAKVFEWIGPALAVENGDILFRIIGESAACERIFYWQDGAVVEREGFNYYEFLPDGTRGDGYLNHPSNIHLDRWRAAVYVDNWEEQRLVRQDEWLPGWTCSEIDTLMSKRAVQSDEVYTHKHQLDLGIPWSGWSDGTGK